MSILQSVTIPLLPRKPPGNSGIDRRRIDHRLWLRHGLSTAPCSSCLAAALQADQKLTSQSPTQPGPCRDHSQCTPLPPLINARGGRGSFFGGWSEQEA